jgi:hypothetical protein
MTRHLAACRQNNSLETLRGSGKLRQTTLLHLLIEAGPYWLQFEVPADATLRDLDQFLRDAWVECCGHLSQFTIAGKRYNVDAQGMLEWGWNETDDKRGMNVKLSEVFHPGVKFDYEYDFGTTTELTGQVISEYVGQAKSHLVQVLARNDPPPIVCQECGQPATQLCADCIWSGSGWLCDECAEKHECGKDMLMPVVNSPRVGMCGYTGPEYEA